MLNKQLVRLNMRGGVDTKLDNLLTLPSKLLQATNVVFDEQPAGGNTGTVTRRGGLTSHPLTALESGGPIANSPRRLFTNNGSCVIEDVVSGPLLVVKDAGQRHVPPAVETNFVRGSLLTSPVSDNLNKFPNGAYTVPLTNGDYDVAFNSTHTRSVWAWLGFNLYPTGINSRVYVGLSVRDEQTGKELASLRLETAETYYGIRVIYCPTSDKFFVYYAVTMSATQFRIRVREIPGAGTVTISGETTVWTSPAYGGTRFIGSADYIPLFDVVIDRNSGDLFFAVAKESATPNDRVDCYILSSANGATAVSSYTLTPTARVWQMAITTSDNSEYYVVYGRGFGAGYVRAIRLLNFTSSTEADVANRGFSGNEFGRIAVDYDVDDSQQLFIAYDNLDINSSSSFIRFSTAANDLSAYTDVTAAISGRWVIGSRLAKTAFGWALVAHNNSATQPTFYLMDVTSLFYNQTTAGVPTVLARVEYGECGYARNDWTQTRRVPSLLSYQSKTKFAFTKWVPDAQLVSGSFIQPSLLNRADFDTADQLGYAEANGLTYLAGGCPYIFDGVNLVEEGFHHAPEISSLTASTTGGVLNGLPNGTYYLTLTCAWQDARGNWHESAPATPVSVVLSGTNDHIIASFLVPPTQKPNMQILWYRTAAGAASGPYYRAQTASGATITSDATLVQGEQLYTVPGVAGQALYHDPAPSCRHIEIHQRRLFLSGTSDGYGVAYSNVIQPGRGVEFNELLDRRTDGEFGRVVATQSQDGRLFVLGERKLGLLLGTGPTDTGEQDGYSEIELVVNDTGAKWEAPNAVVTTDDGTWFQSNTNGIRLFSRNGQLARRQEGAYTGSEVDSFTSNVVIKRALLDSTSSQVRFYDGNSVLVYDKSWGQWSTFSNHNCNDAAFADGRFYHIAGTKLLYYDITAQTDDGTPIVMQLQFPYLQFAGIQGFERVTRLMFLGGALNAQIVTLFVNYNFEPTVTVPINAQEIPSSGGLVQFEHQLTRQKCQALLLQLNIQSKDNQSRFRLTDVTLQVGLKAGRFKLPNTRRF